MPVSSCELWRKIFERMRKEKGKKKKTTKTLNALKWDNTHTDRSADCTEARLACVIRVDSSWVHGQPVPSITPASHPGLTCPMCPGSVWSGLLFLESTFILILITNSSAYDLHPSVLAQVWKHLRLTYYNSDLASSLHHETCSASFPFLPEKNPIFLPVWLFFFDFSPLLVTVRVFCFVPVVFSVYSILLPFISPLSLFLTAFIP